LFKLIKPLPELKRKYPTEKDKIDVYAHSSKNQQSESNPQSQKNFIF
jgi:hypothetical protein